VPVELTFPHVCLEGHNELVAASCETGSEWQPDPTMIDSFSEDSVTLSISHFTGYSIVKRLTECVTRQGKDKDLAMAAFVGLSCKVRIYIALNVEDLKKVGLMP